MAKPTLGLAMIMTNEVTHVPASITQFYHIVDDIVVVDGGSKDESISWAERLGARVIQKPFSNHFADQKNFAIAQLTTDWIYVHDLDERLEPPLVQVIPMLTTEEGQRELMEQGILPVNETYFDCFGIARKNFIDGIENKIYPDYQYRLFANYCRFRGRVFEQVINFRNRTELDYKRTGQPDAGQNIRDAVSRFNILHYKSSTKQQQQDTWYEQLKEQMEKEEEFAKK